MLGSPVESLTLTLCPPGQVGGDRGSGGHSGLGSQRAMRSSGLSTALPIPHVWLLQALNPSLGKKHFEMQKL